MFHLVPGTVAEASKATCILSVHYTDQAQYFLEYDVIQEGSHTPSTKPIMHVVVRERDFNRLSGAEFEDDWGRITWWRWEGPVDRDSPRRTKAKHSTNSAKAG